MEQIDKIHEKKLELTSIISDLQKKSQHTNKKKKQKLEPDVKKNPYDLTELNNKYTFFLGCNKPK